MRTLTPIEFLLNSFRQTKSNNDFFDFHERLSLARNS